MPRQYYSADERRVTEGGSSHSIKTEGRELVHGELGPRIEGGSVQGLSKTGEVPNASPVAVVCLRITIQQGGKWGGEEQVQYMSPTLMKYRTGGRVTYSRG